MKAQRGNWNWEIHVAFAALSELALGTVLVSVLRLSVSLEKVVHPEVFFLYKPFS